MFTTVRCYYNTGLKVNNCLDSISLLDVLFTYRDFPDIAIKQDRQISNIRINTSYNNIADADYCKINDIGYWILGIEMVNDNVASVSLQQDYLTTVGIANFEIIDGWCTRRCVTDDTLFSNMMDEPFSPMHELQIDGCNEIKDPQDVDTTDTINVLLSNIDLLNLTNIAEAYIDNIGDKILIPVLPAVTSGGATQYFFHPNMAAQGFGTSITLTAAYDPNVQTILDAVTKVRSLGIESCIGGSYSLPKRYVDLTNTLISNGLYQSLYDRAKRIESQIAPTWGTYKNNKVYSGQFQQYCIYSLCSGDKNEFKPEDIIDPLDPTQVDYWQYADLRYNGYPIVKPLYFKGNLNDSQFGSVKGAGWQNTPFMYTMGQSGYGVDAMQLSRQLTFDYMNALGKTFEDAAKFTLTGAGAPTAPTAPTHPGPNASAKKMARYSQQMQNYGSQYRAYEENMAYYGTQVGSTFVGDMLNIASASWNFNMGFTNLMKAKPEIQFPIIPQLQDFLGNKFYELRYRLTDADMLRFDKFLTMYGYSVSEPMSNDCLVGRTHFNFVQGSDINIKSSWPLYFRQGIINLLENGVRIWHDAPAEASLSDNPIVVTP